MLLVGLVDAVTYVDSCQELDQEGETYVLVDDIFTDSTCFRITADDITLDFNGYSLTGDDGMLDYGVYSDGYNHITIKNGYIHDFYDGIYFKNNRGNNIANMIINSNSNNGISLGDLNSLSSNNIVENCVVTNNIYGIHIERGSNNTIKGNTINSNNYGINFVRCSDNDVIDNILNSNLFYAINLDDDALNNNVTNITANFNSVGIYIDYFSKGNSFTNISINENTDYGIVIHYFAENNTFTDSDISNSGTNDVLIPSYSFSLDNTFLNVNYDISKEAVDSGSKLTRKWYYRAYVEDENGDPVENADVEIERVGNFKTDEKGYIEINELTEYVNDGDVRDYKDYTVRVSKEGYKGVSKTFNLDRNELKDVFVLEEKLGNTALSVFPEELSPNDNLNIEVIPGTEGVYKYVFIYDSENRYKARINLGCRGYKCYDPVEVSYTIPLNWANGKYKIKVYDYLTRKYVGKEFEIEG